MATTSDLKSTLEEKLIYAAIVVTWPTYLVGGLYILGSVVGWLLLALVLLRIYVVGKHKVNPLPVLAALWLLAMLVMLAALLVAHLNWGLSLGQTLKSSIGWAKGWALLAIFPVCGAILKINIACVSRACCIVACQALLFIILSLFVYLVGGPDILFTSPLKIVGGPGPEFFDVRLFGINPETGLPRWFFFSPWAPAAGLMSCLYLILCWQEKNTPLRLISICACMLMCILSQSRAGWAIFFSIMPIIYLLRLGPKPEVLLCLGILIPLIILGGQSILDLLLDSYQTIKDSRPDSSRVRDALANIAVQRWESEAPIWGHGIVERGPKSVEFMPIGSHHSWYGLLYVKGLVGALALFVPMLISFFYLAFQSLLHPRAASAFGLLLVLMLYSFFENLEILAYLFWPALLWIGHYLNPINCKN